MLNKELVLKRIVKNLGKKGIKLTILNGYLYWNYNKHYSKFQVRLSLYSDSKGSGYIRYYSYDFNHITRNRKTSVKYGNCYSKIYDVLMLVKPELDKAAEKEKIRQDNKEEYCLELESYYNRKHGSVKVEPYKHINSEIMRITITAYNEQNRYSHSYNINYKDKRYYLNYEYEVLNEDIEMLPL